MSANVEKYILERQAKHLQGLQEGVRQPYIKTSRRDIGMENVRDLVALDEISPKSAQICFWKFPFFFYISGKSSKNLKK